MSGKATTIWCQIPTGVKMSIGARNLLFNEEDGYLQFQVGPARKGPFKVTIQLDPDDTYSLALVRVRARSLAVDVLEQAHGIYCDQLGDVLLGWECVYLGD